MKRMALKLAMEDEKSKAKDMKAIAGAGVDSITVDSKEGKITVVGKADPVSKLRKLGYTTDLLSVSPANPKEEK